MPEVAAARPDRGARRLLALALLVAALLLTSAIGLALWGSEGRWLVVARAMALSGEPFSMKLGDQLYEDKPFGSYWLVILSAKLLGGFTEAAGRLPGVLAYLATLAVTYLLGCRTLGARTGALAALLLAASARLLLLAGMASSDPQQLFGLTLALLLLLEASERGRLLDYLLLGVVAGLTTQMKGLPGLALPAFAGLLWTLLVRGWARLSPGGVLLAALAGLTLAGAPYLVARGVQGDWTALQVLWRESVVRAVDPFDHVEPWWFYLGDQFKLLMAWSLLLPAALLHAASRARRAAPGEAGLWRGLRSAEPTRRTAFPLFGYLVVLLFFSLSASRRSYYLMPIAPFAALLVADVLLAAPSGLAAIARRASLVLLGLSGVLLGLLALGCGVLRLWSEAPPAMLTEWLPGVERAWPYLPSWLWATGVVVVPAAALLRARLSPGVLGACVVATSLHWALLAMAVMLPMRAGLDPLPRFAAAVRALVPPAQLADLDDASSARLRFYLEGLPESAPAAPRFRIVAQPQAESLLAADPRWSRVRSPLLEAAAWPADDPEGFVLLERQPTP